MRLRSLFLGFAMVLGVAGSGLAADDLDGEVFEARWTGFYVGAVGGYHAGDVNFTNCTGFCPTDPKYNSWGLGVQAGYDHQFENNLVVGGYVNVPLVSSKNTFNIGFPGFDFTIKPKYAAFVGGRIGYDFNGFLPYVAGGYNVARMEATAFFGARRSNTHHGYHLAIGMEYLVTRNISTDLRYTFSHFGRRTYDFGGGASNWGENASNITAAINFRF